MTSTLVLCGIVAIYLGIAIWATRYIANQDFTYANAFNPMSVWDAIFLLCCVFTPLSILIIPFALLIKVENMDLWTRYENLLNWIGKKIVRLASWMFLPRKKDATSQIEKCGQDSPATVAN